MKTVLKKYNYGQKSPHTTKEMLEDAMKYANREWVESDYFEMKNKYDKKTFLNLFYEGSSSLMELTEQAFKDVRLENAMLKQGIHPLLVSVEEAKLFHSKEYGTHSPVISTHHIKIGTTHGESRTQTGLIADLYKAGYLQEITPEGLIAYAFEQHKILIRVHSAKKNYEEINNKHKIPVKAPARGPVRKLNFPIPESKGKLGAGFVSFSTFHIKPKEGLTTEQSRKPSASNKMVTSGDK